MNGLTLLYLESDEFLEAAIACGMEYTGSTSTEFVEEWLTRDYIEEEKTEVARWVMDRLGSPVE